MRIKPDIIDPCKKMDRSTNFIKWKYQTSDFRKLHNGEKLLILPNVTDSDIFCENIFTIVQKHTEKFKDVKSFEEYYLLFASHNLNAIKDLFKVEPEALDLYGQLYKNSYSFKPLPK